MPARVFGHIAGSPTGSAYISRKEAAAAGVHRPLQAGICGTANGAESIVVSGGYIDDQDFGNVIVYTGEDGRHPSSGRQIANQELKKGNLALARSSLNGLPVRVIRGFQGDPAYSPRTGYRYDGLFSVDDFWRETGIDGFQIWRFRLVATQRMRAESSSFTSEVGDSNESANVETTVQRIVRSTPVSNNVKQLHDYICQVCELRLETPAGPYAEATHIRPRSVPHSGPNEVQNLLCLCPNDHVRFCTGAIYIDKTSQVCDATTATPIRPLRQNNKHGIDPNHLKYHRIHFAGQAE